MGDEVATALGRAGMDDEFARDVIERSQDRYLLGLSRCRHAQVRTRLRPYPGEIGMRQRLALVAKEENNVACLGLLLAQLQAQADPFHLACCLTSLQRVPGPPPTELFFRNALDSCARLMLRPSRASISARRRGIVQLGRSATGSCSNGVTTRKAVALFTAGGPAATLARSASTPPAAKSLRHRRTVSSRTPNASAILGLVQPASVSSTARARSASPRSREPARTRKRGALLVARCHRRLARHATHPRIRVATELQNLSVGQPSRICLARNRPCAIQCGLRITRLRRGGRMHMLLAIGPTTERR